MALRGADAQHLYEEAPDQPHHTVKVLHLDPARRVDLGELRSHLRERSQALPLLRRRLCPAVSRHPWWQELPTVDVHRHVDLVRVAAGRGALDDAIARELTGTLDRDRPLWQIRLLDAPHEQAVVLRASHALLDGYVASFLLTDLFGADPVVRTSESVSLRRQPWEALHLAGRLVPLVRRGVAAGVRKARVHAPGAIAPFAGGAGPWNDPCRTAERSFSSVTLPLPEVLRAARAADATLTGLLLAMVGGALRDRLLTTGALPERTLTAVVPFDVRLSGDPETSANHATWTFADTGTAVDLPADRLAVAQASLRAARARLAVGDDRLADDAQDVWPLLRLSHTVARAITRRVIGRPPASLVVSTVRGPSDELRVCGARVTAIASGGILADELGLNVTAWSYADTLTIGVVARPDAVDDLAGLADAIAAELAHHGPRPSVTHHIA